MIGLDTAAAAQDRGSAPRIAAVIVLAGRIGYGAALIVVPARVARSWLGPAAGTAASQVALRGVGAREITLHAAALAATVGKRPVRGWLVLSIAGDLADIAATAAASRGLPAGAAGKTLAVAGASALASAGIAVSVDR